MIKKINLIIATVYSILLAVVETLLNWGNWQYPPLWIVDYLIVIILLLGIFVYKENQQKVLFAKWMFSSPNLILLDEPTRGVDVGAKRKIYELIRDLASKGKIPGMTKSSW